MSRAFKHDIQHPVHLAFASSRHKSLSTRRIKIKVMGKKGAKKRVATKRASTEDMQDSLLSAQRETEHETEHEADMQMEQSSTGKQQRTDGEEEGVGESSDSESLLSSVAAEKPRPKKNPSN